MDWMVIPPKPSCSFYLIPPKSLSYLISQIPLFLNPNTIPRKQTKKNKSESTEPELNAYL